MGTELPFHSREVVEDVRLNGKPALERVQLSGSVIAYELGLILRCVKRIPFSFIVSVCVCVCMYIILESGGYCSQRMRRGLHTVLLSSSGRKI